MIKKLLIAIALLTSVSASAQSTHVPATLNEYIHHVLDSIYNNVGPRSITRQNVANLYLDLARFDSASYVPYVILGQPDGVATLGGDGKVPASQLATIALGNTYVVADQAAMLSLNASVGDIAVRVDSGITFVLQTAPATIYSNWVQIVVNYIPVSSILGAQAINDTTTYDATKTDLANAQIRQDGINTNFLKQGGDNRGVVMGSLTAKNDTILVNGVPRFTIDTTGHVTIFSTGEGLSIKNSFSASDNFGMGWSIKSASGFNPAIVGSNTSWIRLANSLMWFTTDGYGNISSRWHDYTGNNVLYGLVTDTSVDGTGAGKFLYKIRLDSFASASALIDSNKFLNYTKSLILRPNLDTPFILSQISDSVQPVYQALTDSADSIRSSAIMALADTASLLRDSIKGKISYSDTSKELVTKTYSYLNGRKIYNVLSFGVKINDTTFDATQGFQAAIDTADAHNWDGPVVVPGLITLKSPLLKSTPDGYPINSQVYIPVHTLSGKSVQPWILGTSNISYLEGADTTIPQTLLWTGSIIYSTINNDGSAFPSVISTSGDTIHNVFYDGVLDTQRNYRANYISSTFENLCIRVHQNTISGAQLCGIDMYQGDNNVFKNCRADIDTPLFNSTQPANNTFGLRGVRTNLGTQNEFRSCISMGHAFGYVCGEHTVMDNCQAMCDIYAAELTNAHHSSVIEGLQVQWCKKGISTGHIFPIGFHQVDIKYLDGEHYVTNPAKWYYAVNDVDDSLNYLIATIHFQFGNPIPGHAWTGLPGLGSLQSDLVTNGAFNTTQYNLIYAGDGKLNHAVGDPSSKYPYNSASKIFGMGSPNNEWVASVGTSRNSKYPLVLRCGQINGGGFGFMKGDSTFIMWIDDAGDLILPNMATVTSGTLLPTVVNTTANAYGANIVDKMSIPNYRTLIGINSDTGISAAGSLGAYAPVPTVTSNATGHVITFSQSTSAAFTVLANNTSSTAASTYVSIPTMLTEAVQTATDASYTVTAPTTYSTVVILPTATASHTLTLPSAATYSGRYIKIWNKNTSGTFLWTYVTTVKDGTSTTITAIANGAWAIIWSDGANWNKQN